MEKQRKALQIATALILSLGSMFVIPLTSAVTIEANTTFFSTQTNSTIQNEQDFTAQQVDVSETNTSLQRVQTTEPINFTNINSSQAIIEFDPLKRNRQVVNSTVLQQIFTTTFNQEYFSTTFNNETTIEHSVLPAVQQGRIIIKPNSNLFIPYVEKGKELDFR